MPDIKLAILIQKRLQILLHNIRFDLPILMKLLIPHELFNLHRRRHLNPIPPIGILPRLHNPHLIDFLNLVLFEQFQPFVVFIAGRHVVGLR